MKKDTVLKPDNKPRRRSGQKKLMPLLKSLMLILVALMVVFIVARTFKENNRTSGIFSSPVNSYPYAVSAEDVIDFRLYGSGIAVLTNNGITYINSPGEVTGEYKLTYKKPAMDIKNSRALIYDRGGYGYCLQKSGGTYYEKTADYEIITGTMCRNGTYALATRAQGAVSELFVYNLRNELIFGWQCAYDHIVSIDLSENGKFAAVIAIGGADAQIYSKVYVFNLKTRSLDAEYEYKDTSLYEAVYLSKNVLDVNGDNVRSLIENGAKTDSNGFSGLSARKKENVFNVGGAKLFAELGNDNYNKLMVFDKNGAELFTKDFPYSVNGISADKYNIAVVSGDKIEIFNYKGEAVSVIEPGYKAAAALILSGTAYVQSMNGIDKFLF
ncbi:MAG: DUF5711 family protein [Oscillospiraceae bacterium]|nr:DUF5711 family protein [Oscillospiraceae bacterium]